MRFLFILAIGILASRSYAESPCHETIQNMIKLEYKLVRLDTRVTADFKKGESLVPEVMGYTQKVTSPSYDQDCQDNSLREFISLAIAATPFEVEDRLASFVVATAAASPAVREDITAKMSEFSTSYADYPTAACRAPLFRQRYLALVCSLAAPEHNTCFDHPFDFNRCVAKSGN